MVCVPCFLIPFLLFLWRFIQPYVLRIWNPFEKKDGENKSTTDISECSLFASCPCLKKKENGETAETVTSTDTATVADGQPQEVTAGDNPDTKKSQ